MRERDINRNFSDQRELQRIATILFPKKGQHLPHSHQPTAHSRTLTQPPIMATGHRQQASEEGGEQVRSEIDKLRKEINCMLARGGGEQQSRVTQYAYLDGINRMAKGLAISASEVREAFDEFLEYLPTRLTSQPRSYAQHYHYSLLLQHVAWYKLEKALKAPLVVGFQAIREQAQSISELQERVALVERQREERNQKRRHLEMGRAMLAWRMNGHCIAAKQQSDEYLREHGLEGQQRLSQSLLNLPLLVLMLEELGREAADISELLLLDPTGERATKFMEEGLSGISSSLETVTQRSLLQTDRSSVKFSRFQVVLGPSLTALCVRRGEILFVSSLAKSADYGHADNLCYWQSLGRSSPPSLRGGAIFYPIFDANARCMAILRQYFYEGALTAINSGKLERICTFLELGVNLDQRMRSISREREYIKEDYYMKMIGTVRKVELADGEGEAMKLLEEEFKGKLGVQKIAIYRIQSSPGENRQLLLRRVWGEGEDLNAIMTLAHQLLKQQRNYIYLEDRLLVYANQALFDLRLPHDRYSPANSPQNTPKQTLPIELIVKVLSKVQSLLAVKEREGKMEVARAEEIKISQAKEQYQKLRNAVEEISLEFISKSNEEDYIEQINCYLNKLHILLGSKQDLKEASAIYMQYQLGKAKKEKYWLKLGEHHASLDKIPEGMLKIHISQAAALYCQVQLQKQAKSFEAIIIKAIELFMAAYTSLKLQKNIKNSTNQAILTEMQVSKPILVTPTKQDKKIWQKYKLQHIFQTFRQRVQNFAERTLQCHGQVVWAKEKPCSFNIEDWKHSIYRLLQNKEAATIQLTGKYPLISYNEYRTLRVLTSHQLTGISEECSLVITGSKGYRSKNSIYENSFMLTFPVFYYQGDGTTTAERAIAEGLQQLKEAFLLYCQQFVDGVNLLNQRLASSAARSVIFLLEDQQLTLKKTAFRAIKAKSDNQGQIRKNICHFQKKIDIVQRKLIFKSFCRMYAFSQDKLHRKRRIVYQLQPIGKLCSVTSKIIFGRVFSKLNANYGRQIQAQKGLLKIESFLRTIQLQRMQWSFAKMHLATSQRSSANQLILTISSLFQSYKATAFFKIKCVEGAKAVADPTFSQFQQCRSFAEIKQKLAMVAPQFMLILQATPEQQILLHSPNISTQPVDPFALGLTNTYQAGPDGNFLWYYSPKEGASAFRIKDRLNTLSKCLEVSLKNCKKAMGSALLHCASFKGNWIRRAKAKTLRIWALESSRLEMAERNKLNDSLYQMGIQSKTIKEKLKAQEKILRNHSIQNQELLQKQEQYRRAITANSHQISAIEQGQIKLENARSLYHSLHRRGVLKGIFLLWRVNSSEIGIKNTKKQLENNPHFIKIGLKTISRIFDRKRKEYLSDLVWRLSQVKRAVAISPRVQKIQVLFEGRAARLVTFQSQLQEQENSQQSSNRSDSSQLQHSKRHFDLNRSPLQRVELSADEYLKHSNGAYRLNPKTLKFLKRMGKLEG